MNRLVALAVLAVLALSQYAALSCPMDLPAESGGHADHGAMAHGAMEHGVQDGDAYAGHAETSGEHDDHRGPDSCLILMSCGTLAVSDLGTTVELLRPEADSRPNTPAASLESFSPDIESPPPRRG